MTALGRVQPGNGRPAPTWYSAVPTIHQEVLRQATLQLQQVHPAPAAPALITTAPNMHVLQMLAAFHSMCLLQTGKPPDHSLVLIRNCSAALPAAIGARLEAALPGVVVCTTYAMTEALPICSNPADGRGRDLSSVGPAAGPEVAVVGGDGVRVQDGEEGEVVVRGQCVFGGYESRPHFGAEDPNIAAFLPGGWLRTGDKGRMLLSGQGGNGRAHLQLTGRVKELVNRCSLLPTACSLLSSLPVCSRPSAVLSSAKAVNARLGSASATATFSPGPGKRYRRLRSSTGCSWRRRSTFLVSEACLSSPRRQVGHATLPTLRLRLSSQSALWSPRGGHPIVG